MEADSREMPHRPNLQQLHLCVVSPRVRTRLGRVTEGSIIAPSPPPYYLTQTTRFYSSDVIH
jgi:hypothetical protein